MQQFNGIARYLYKKFVTDIKVVSLGANFGQGEVFLRLLEHGRIIDGEIEIQLQENTPSNLTNDNAEDYDQNENGASATVSNSKATQLIFSSRTQSLPQIQRYIENLIFECNKLESRELPTYVVNVRKQEKSRAVSWKYQRATTNKVISNTIVNPDVHEKFYNDLSNFVAKKEVINKRGGNFNRGYILHGPTGTGKSSLCDAVANTHNYPIFRMDLSVLESNSEVKTLLHSINDYIQLNEVHILLFEDFDSASVFQRYGGSKISRDCLLEMFESRGCHGRIIVATTNELDKIKNYDRTGALFRPGRIDREIFVGNLQPSVVQQILQNFFDFDNESELQVNDDVDVSVSHLNKVIQLFECPHKVVAFLNKYKTFEDGLVIGELFDQFKEQLEKSTKESCVTQNDLNVDDAKVFASLLDQSTTEQDKILKKAAKRVKHNKSKRDQNRVKFPRKPPGYLELMRLEKALAKSEHEMSWKNDSNALEAEIEMLTHMREELRARHLREKLGDAIDKYEIEYSAAQMEQEKRNREEQVLLDFKADAHTENQVTTSDADDDEFEQSLPIFCASTVLDSEESDSTGAFFSDNEGSSL